MHFYAIGYADFLKLPIYTFWELSKNVDRIRAEEDKRQFMLLSTMFSENPAEYIERLNKEMGEIIEAQHGDHGFDEKGFNQLKALMGKA